MSDSWERVAYAGIGGLTDVGFSPDGRFLLVVGHQGRGVFDCQTGERLARDRTDDWSYFDMETGTAEGIGPLDGQSVPIAGLMSDAQLPAESAGWTVTATGEEIVLRSSTGVTQSIRESEELKVFGFSPDGVTFVIGASSGVSIYARSR